MTTRRSVRIDYPETPDTIVQLLADPDFHQWRGSELGERAVEVSVTTEGDGHRVVVRKEKEAEVPGFAAKFVSPTNRVEENVLWRRDGAGWRGEYCIHIDGVPGDVRGVTRIAPTATGGCEYLSEVEIEAKVPVLRAKLERLLAERVGETMTRAAEKTAERLTRR